MSADDDDELGLSDAAPNPAGGWGLRAFRTLLPAYPDETVIPLVRLKPPPKLPPIEELDEAATASLLVRLFMGARGAMFGGGTRPPRDIPAMRGYKAVVAAGHILRATDVAPGAWLLYSFREWRARLPATAKAAAKPSARYHGNSAPTMSWTFATSRLTGKRSEIAVCRASALGSVAHVHTHVEHKEMIRAWTEARAALDALPYGADVAQAQAAVAGLAGWSERVQVVRGAVVRYQAVVDSEIERGKWLWQ